MVGNGDDRKLRQTACDGTSEDTMPVPRNTVIPRRPLTSFSLYEENGRFCRYVENDSNEN